MKCLRCQQVNPEGQKFCGDCGTPLQPVGGSAQSAPSYAALQRSLTEALEQQAATSEIGSHAQPHRLAASRPRLTTHWDGKSVDYGTIVGHLVAADGLR